MKPRHAIPCLLILLAVAFFVSCQKSFHQETERYVFISANISLPYWQEAQAGFMDAASVLGVKAEFTGPNTYAPEEQLKAFQAAVATHPTGILVSPTRPELFKDAIDAAMQAGIPVICVDSDSPGSRRMLFMGTDNYRAGIEIGNRIAQLLHERGLVVVISIPGQFNLDERYRGVQDALKKYKEMEITRTIDDKGESRQAADQLATLIDHKQRIDGIVCLEASGGPGAAEALQRFGLSGRIPIVAMDKNPETLDWIKKGVIPRRRSLKNLTR